MAVVRSLRVNVPVQSWCSAVQGAWSDGAGGCLMSTRNVDHLNLLSG